MAQDKQRRRATCRRCLRAARGVKPRPGNVAVVATNPLTPQEYAMTIRRTLAAAIVASAIAAPAASAMPAPPDMHGSTAVAAAKAQRAQKQDLRSADAADAALHPRKSPVVVNAPGATVVDSQSTDKPVAPGQPTWAVNPQPLHAPAQPASTSASDDGTDWTTIAIGAGLTLLIIGGIALVSRSKALPRTRLSA